MMRLRIAYSLFVFFILIFLFVPRISSDLTDLSDTAEKITDVSDTLSDSDLRTEYLKQEWTNMLNNTAIGPYIQKLDNAFEISSPFFEVILGIPYSLSWTFVLSLLIFILLLVYAYRISSFFESFLLRYGNYARILLFFVMAIIISITRVPKAISFVIINFVSNEGTWQAQLISMFVVLVIVILLGAYSKYIAQFFANLKKTKKMLDLERKTIQELKAGKENRKQLLELKERLERRIRRLEGDENSGEKEDEEIKEARELLIEIGRKLSE